MFVDRVNIYPLRSQDGSLVVDHGKVVCSVRKFHRVRTENGWAQRMAKATNPQTGEITEIPVVSRYKGYVPENLISEKQLRPDKAGKLFAFGQVRGEIGKEQVSTPRGTVDIETLTVSEVEYIEKPAVAESAA